MNGEDDDGWLPLLCRMTGHEGIRKPSFPWPELLLDLQDLIKTHYLNSFDCLVLGLTSKDNYAAAYTTSKLSGGHASALIYVTQLPVLTRIYHAMYRRFALHKKYAEIYYTLKPKILAARTDDIRTLIECLRGRRLVYMLDVLFPEVTDMITDVFVDANKWRRWARQDSILRWMGEKESRLRLCLSYLLPNDPLIHCAYAVRFWPDRGRRLLLWQAIREAHLYPWRLNMHMKATLSAWITSTEVHTNLRWPRIRLRVPQTESSKESSIFKD
jgi:hypothetical protein